MLNKLIRKRMDLIREMAKIGEIEKKINPELTFHDFLNLPKVKVIYKLFLDNMTDFLTQGDGGLILIQTYDSPQYQAVIENKSKDYQFEMKGTTTEEVVKDYIKYLDYYVWKCNRVQIKTFEYVKDLFFEKCGHNLVSYLLNDGNNSEELVAEFKSMKEEPVVKSAINIHNKLVDDLNGLLHELDRLTFKLNGFDIPSYKSI